MVVYARAIFEKLIVADLPGQAESIGKAGRHGIFSPFLMFNKEWSSETGAWRSRRVQTKNVAPRGAHEGEHGRRAPTRNVAPRGAHEGEHGRRAQSGMWLRRVPMRVSMAEGPNPECGTEGCP